MLKDLSNAPLAEMSSGGVDHIGWLKDESKALLGWNFEAGIGLFIVDIPTGTIHSLQEAVGIDGSTQEKWAFTPDGATLAFTDLVDYRL